ncbi:lysine transporter LysE [Maritimibacter sp. 55A14]|uniref:LysE family translocator n=1 Tax=Maritimibacter sp. 55A14 TaxID=2174844 RepID=UPI000D617961|nr:LysE family translocator [Maritimibacter sp. 55A14]PWE32130.1 lysine transporter LysE [Maritimibacter sp. 55A14]
MTDTLPALLFFLAPLAYSPGPGNLFFAALGARFGPGAAVPALAGYHLATFVVTLAIGLGFARLIAAAPAFLPTIRLAGGAYVLWLAWRFAGAGAADAQEAGTAARPASAGSGALLLVVNAKAYLIIGLMFTQFLGLQPERTLAPVLWLAAVFTVNNLLAFLIWTYLGSRLARGLRDARAARRLNLVCGAMLAGVAIWLMAG